MICYLRDWTETFSSRKGTITLSVRRLIGRTLTFNDLHSSNDVKDLRWKIYELVGIPGKQQRLIFDGSTLQDGRTLADYRIKSNCSIHLVVRLSGC